MSRTRYLSTMGELSRKDNSLCFRRNGENVYIPIENTKEVYCLNEVSMNTKLLTFLSKNHVIMHFFNYYGGYSGSYFPKEQYNSGRLLIKQVEKFDTDRLSIAKPIVNGIGSNMSEVLKHYAYHGKSEIKPAVEWLNYDFKELVQKAPDIKRLMTVEGEAWMKFYAQFPYIMPEEFTMEKRVKRPPDNPINAMVSFGNSLLYTKTITAIYHTHLDQRVSFLHEPSEGRFSLSLDLCEVFKPIIVFKTIFNLVNQRKIQVSKHFDKNLNNCLLNEEGRKIFIKEFEARMENRI